MRKKLHIAEFQELGFDYTLNWEQKPTVAQQDAFIDQFLEEVIEMRGLRLGCGCTQGAIAGSGKNPTEHDQEAVRIWLQQWPGVVHVQMGPLVDAWYDDGH